MTSRKKSSGFEFWSCVIYTWPWCIFLQILRSYWHFRNPRQRPPPSWIFKSCTFGTFRHVNSVVLELYIKFRSNICESHWDQHTYAHLMTSRELNMWLSPYGRGASSHKIWCRYIYISSSELLTFFPKFKMAAAAILDFQFMWIWPFRRVDTWYDSVVLCSVPNLVQISVIVTKIDAHMLQTFIWWRLAN